MVQAILDRSLAISSEVLERDYGTADPRPRHLREVMPFPFRELLE